MSSKDCLDNNDNKIYTVRRGHPGCQSSVKPLGGRAPPQTPPGVTHSTPQTP